MTGVCSRRGRLRSFWKLLSIRPCHSHFRSRAPFTTVSNPPPVVMQSLRHECHHINASISFEEECARVCHQAPPDATPRLFSTPGRGDPFFLYWWQLKLPRRFPTCREKKGKEMAGTMTTRFTTPSFWITYLQRSVLHRRSLLASWQAIVASHLVCGTTGSTETFISFSVLYITRSLATTITPKVCRTASMPSYVVTWLGSLELYQQVPVLGHFWPSPWCKPGTWLCPHTSKVPVFIHPSGITQHHGHTLNFYGSIWRPLASFLLG